MAMTIRERTREVALLEDTGVYAAHRADVMVAESVMLSVGRRLLGLLAAYGCF